MKFAIPLAEGKLSLHFGHCKEFALITVEDDKVVAKEVLEPPPHEPGVLPRWLADQNVNVVLAGGMGHRAIELFQQAGIKVLTGSPALGPDELVSHYLAGTLTTGENVCDH